jgi:hypothetical protein
MEGERRMNLKQLIIELNDRLRLEHGQTTDEYALVLCVISGTSVFLLNGMSGQLATGLINVARLLP